MKKILVFTAVLLTSTICALSQKVGIGTSTPIARLEVKGEGNTSTTNNLVLRNSIGDTLLRMRNDGRMTIGYNGVIAGRPLNIGGIGVNFYLTDTHFGGAIFPEDSSLVIWSEFGDNKFINLQPQWGKVGIGTSVPKVKLHVRNGVSNATPHSNSVAAFESSTNGYINLLTPIADESGIFFGNQTSAVHGGIVYNSVVANGLSFRTNGNLTRMVISSAGNVGIGTLSPQKKLHASGGESGATATSSAIAVVESNVDVSINLLTAVTETSALYFGNSINARHGGIAYNSTVANGLEFLTNGNLTRAVINNAGNLGIGDNSPGARLHIKGFDGSINNHIRLEDNNSTDFASMYYTGDLVFRNEKALGDFYFKDNAGNNAMSLFSSGNMTIGGTLTETSDQRLKHRIQPLSSALEKLMRLNGCNYYWKPELNKDTSLQTGLIAQNVEEVIPELVRSDAEGIKSVNYSGVTPYLIEAIKEQQTVINAQQLKLDALEKEMAEVRSLLLQMTDADTRQ